MTDSEKEWIGRMAGLPFVEFTPSVGAVFGCRPPTSLVRTISKDLGLTPDLRGRKYLPTIEEFEAELDATRDFFRERRVFPRKKRLDIVDSERGHATGKAAGSILNESLRKSFAMWKTYLPGFQRWSEYVEAARQACVTLPEGASDVEAAWANMGTGIPQKVTCMSKEYFDLIRITTFLTLTATRVAKKDVKTPFHGDVKMELRHRLYERVLDDVQERGLEFVAKAWRIQMAGMSHASD